MCRMDSDFYELGLGEPVPISAANMLNLGDLLDLVIGEFRKAQRGRRRRRY